MPRRPAWASSSPGVTTLVVTLTSPDSPLDRIPSQPTTLKYLDAISPCVFSSVINHLLGWILVFVVNQKNVSCLFSAALSALQLLALLVKSCRLFLYSSLAAAFFFIFRHYLVYRNRYSCHRLSSFHKSLISNIPLPSLAPYNVIRLDNPNFFYQLKKKHQNSHQKHLLQS